MSTIEQFIDLMDADERLLCLYKLMSVLPPSAVDEAFEEHQVKCGNPEAE